MKVLALNKVDVTRYPIGHMIYGWVKIEGERLFLVRSVPA